ncbi:ImmA/IrrE family metallo-endopeptidase [Granulicella sp. S190]|uniref:ImmA/IrrE family metallo-endopeptidase n=1 Tax=Granulicella sp. S190 TaxID=1747226 RepID=UPI00131A8CC7|nr:ImmA/IrrE family metallo-endopeptidase [Granulicella sp. S190]
MKQLNRKQIEQRVLDLLDEHDVTSVPVPVERIARSVGLPIVETEMDADVSGALIRSGNLQGIAVNASQAPVRKRFTIAHELAHFLLNHVDKDHVDWQFTVIRRDGRSSEAEDDQEMAANFFAASLLMPKDILRQDVELHQRFDGEIHLDDADIGLLAKRYKVSEAAMKYRLQNLGFMSWA